jgi:hypothetical protein
MVLKMNMLLAKKKEKKYDQDNGENAPLVKG